MIKSFSYNLSHRCRYHADKKTIIYKQVFSHSIHPFHFTNSLEINQILILFISTIAITRLSFWYTVSPFPNHIFVTSTSFSNKISTTPCTQRWQTHKIVSIRPEEPIWFGQPDGCVGLSELLLSSRNLI